MSILDPHGSYLSDTRAKLRALAAYAEQHGDCDVRVQSMVKVGETLRVLDLDDPTVRTAVLTFEGADVSGLYEGHLARDYA